MKILYKIYFTIILFYFFNISLFAQFNTDAYKQFLTQNENLTTADLLKMHNAGFFENNNANWQNALFSDSIEIKYELTEDEINLINKNGFVVSERLQQPSFGAQLTDIYHKDLPVYISSDAILHAFHTTYDKILKDIELNILIGKLDELITSLQNNFPDLNSKVSTQANLDTMLKDLDVYLTVAKQLLTGSAIPYYEENVNAVDDLIKDIESEEFVTRPLFSESLRKIDFSQFKPRGHYDDEVYPQLANYFKTMMWFDKIELYLIAPKSFDEVPIEDVQRQIIISALFSELIAVSNQKELFNEIEFIIKTFVGEQDNVTLPGLEEVLGEANITSVDLLLDTLVVKEFQNVLKTKSYAGQKILSQILMSDPMSPDKIEPASAFMPFGQRFVIDSYVTGNVVYDKTEKKRMLPSTLDILFALGTDAAAQILKDELDTYEYSSNLAALRYLIDNYDSDFWKNSIYNLWLNSIKSLNPPEDRTALPNFMQTAAWWQQKMNSQLASWTELRHDNLLYAKQSYSGGVTCSYPFSYVEPIPLFFKTIGLTATETINKINMISSFDSETKEKITSHFKYWELITDTLETIAQKELDRTALDENEKGFLSRMLYNNPQGMCGVPEHIGWYPSLYYYNKEEMNESNFLVADYHTAPTDASGNFVGWVKHAGTGPIDLAIIIAKNSDNQDVAFVGPVSSYYEFTSDNFLRLTDDEWKESYLLQSARPNWTNIYLADNSGKVKSEGLKLLTDVKKDDVNSIIPQSFITAQNYPNPFNPSTVISFTVPLNSERANTKLTIYSIQGEVIKELVNENLNPGSYLIRWNGDNKFGINVSSGVYFYEVRNGINKFVGKMNLMK